MRARVLRLALLGSVAALAAAAAAYLWHDLRDIDWSTP